MDGVAELRGGTHVRRRPGRRVWSIIALGLATVLTLPLVGAVREPRAAAALPGRAPCTGATYTVVSGDYWFRIASQAAVSLNALLAANDATTGTAIYPGNVVCLPAGAIVPSTTTTTTTTVPGASIAQFPVQGPCAFVDSYGASRSGGRRHEGVDIIAKTGQYVYAVSDGTLTKKYVDAPGALSGNGWRLTAADGTYYFYAHFSAFAAGLDLGSKVKAGQIIGFVGMTGNAGTPHLHFEVHPGGGAPINPTPLVRAVDGCKVTTAPPQPGGSVPAKVVPATTTTVPSSTTSTTVKSTTTTTTVPKSTPTTTLPKSSAGNPTTTTTTPTVPGASGDATRWQFIAPVLALDTAGQRLTPNTARTVKVNALAGVPATTPGVMVRMAARNIGGDGYVTIHPCDGAPVQSSSLNLSAARVNATMTVVKVTGGSICVTSSVAVDVKIDVVGYLAADGVGAQPITARRALDSRSGAIVAAGTTRSMSPKALGITSGSKAVTVTVTLINPAVSGSLGIGPCGGTPWIVGYGPTVNQVFSAIVRTNAAGICVTPSANVHLVVDVTGVWTGSTSFAPAGPQRKYDARHVGPVGHGTTSVQLAGLPPGTSTAQFTIAILGGSSSGALFAWNCSRPKPAASVGSSDAAIHAAVTVTMDVTGGALCLSATTPMYVVVDLTATG